MGSALNSHLVLGVLLLVLDQPLLVFLLLLHKLILQLVDRLLNDFLPLLNLLFHLELVFELKHLLHALLILLRVFEQVVLVKPNIASECLVQLLSSVPNRFLHVLAATGQDLRRRVVLQLSLGLGLPPLT